MMDSPLKRKGALKLNLYEYIHPHAYLNTEQITLLILIRAYFPNILNRILTW